MSLITSLIGFGLRQALDFDGDGIGGVAGAIHAHFSNHGRTLERALVRAHDNAWKALACTLAGDSLLGRFGTFFASADQKGFREEVRLFLADRAAQMGEPPVALRRACLAELDRLRRSKRLTVTTLVPAEVAQAAAEFGRHADLGGLIDGAMRAVGHIADVLREEYPALARLLRQPAGDRPPLLVAAFAFFFRREVEHDDELANGLMVDGLRRLAASQAKALGELERAMQHVGEQLDAGLAEIAGELCVLRDEVGEAREAALQARDSADRLFAQVQDLIGKVGLSRRELKPQDSFSIRGSEERRAVKALLETFRALPGERRERVPELLRDLSRLLFGVGDFDQARTLAEQAAQRAEGDESRAESFHDAYRAALEQGNWTNALDNLHQALALVPARFAPFPLVRYEIQCILGSGGFGTVFLCHDLYFRQREVAIKALHGEVLERELADVFGEAHALTELQHPAIIGVLDCNYADPERRARPYIVMPYFPGLSLYDYLEEHGSLSLGDLLAIARSVAEAMAAAHEHGILHRDLKPDNILVRPPSPRGGEESRVRGPSLTSPRGGEGSGVRGWEVKVIDFGLAMRRDTIETSMEVQSAGTTTMAESVAGTLRYSPPEQLRMVIGGKRVAVGTYSDVYAFGKTCCQALFGTTQPTRGDWRGVPDALADILEACIIESVVHRQREFRPVVEALRQVDPAVPQPVPARPEREQKLAALLRTILDRSHGKLTAQDTVEVNDWVRRHQVPRERAESIIRVVREEWQRERSTTPRAGDLFTITLPGGRELKLAYIPAGSFLMGSAPGEWLRDIEDGPQHRVNLSLSFYLGIYPVTQAEWQAIMGTNPSRFAGDDRPVEQVSWDDSQEFCRKLSKLIGRTFRLPTEAEWEYACRAGTTTPFSFGDTITTGQANFNSRWPATGPWPPHLGVYRAQTTPVGKFPPNAWGLYDMHGNVWEWCRDKKRPYPAEREEVTDPVYSQGARRAVRGGSWINQPVLCRSACRCAGAPGARLDILGCRVAMCADM
jgi:formylglycine-generating enzyme required for sulfatase activity/tetratricopeptide (TPR) repeat protein